MKDLREEVETRLAQRDEKDLRQRFVKVAENEKDDGMIVWSEIKESQKRKKVERKGKKQRAMQK